MKLNKIMFALGISLFSTMTLGNLNTQSVKADTTNQQTNIDSNTTETSTDTQTQDNSTSQSITNTSIQSDTSSNKNDATTELVNITLVDNNGNEVVNSQGDVYKISQEYSVGDTINPSNLSDKITKDLNGAYSLDSNQNTITVANGENNYTFKVTAKKYDIWINSSDGSGFSSKNSQISVGQKTAVNYIGNGQVPSPVIDLTLNGYGFSYLAFNNSNKEVANSSDGTLTLSYDMIPDLLNTYTSNSGYILKAVYNVPLPQSLTLQHVDDQGNTIPGSTDQKVTGYKTGDVIDDPYSLATEKDILGYTYLKTTKPYTVSDNNNIKLIYTNDSVNYFKVNYIDNDTGKTIYTDTFRGSNGDTVDVKDISTIGGFDNYKMVNSSIVGNYTIGTSGELNVDITKKDPLTLNIIQTTGNNVSVSSTYVTEYGDSLDYTNLVYLGNLSNVKSINISANGQSYPIPKEQLDESIAAGYSLTDFMNSTLPNGSDKDNLYTVNDDSTGLNYTIEIVYDTTKTTNVSYQTSDGTVVDSNSITNDDSSTNINADDFVKNNLPTGYEFIDDNNPYHIASADDNTTELISQVQKISDSNTSGGDSSNGSGGSDNNTGDKETIEETLGTHPNLSSINIYDDNGNSTGSTISPNTDWFTDEKMILNGKTYYRIATDQWVNVNDIYIYYNNPSYVRTYSDSYKLLVNSQDQAITNRGLAAGSDWVSDRYAYFNDQKHYRVATNEWINASDAFEYQPIDQVIQTTSNAQLFDDKGNVVRTIPSLSLKADKSATINGTKMYRVATNEWLPVTDIK